MLCLCSDACVALELAVAANDKSDGKTAERVWGVSILHRRTVEDFSLKHVAIIPCICIFCGFPTLHWRFRTVVLGSGFDTHHLVPSPIRTLRRDSDSPAPKLAIQDSRAIFKLANSTPAICLRGFQDRAFILSVVGECPAGTAS